MKPIKKILVPVDYSPTASNAFTYALLLASELGAEIQLLNCVHPGMAAPEIPSLTVDLTHKLIGISQESMADFTNEGLTRVAQTVKQLPLITKKVMLGSAVPLTKAIAREEKADLIIMGTQGAAGFWEKLFGTVSGDMLMNAPCPILVVPEGASFRPFTKLCFASDLEGFDVFCGDQLVKAFGSYRPDLHLIHISDNQRETHPFDFELIDLAYTRQALDVAIEVEERNSKDVPTSIIDSAHECGADLIVMSRPHYSFVDQLFHRSVTRDVVQQSDLPMLILPQETLEAELS